MFRYFQAFSYIGSRAITVHISQHVSKRHSYYFASKFKPKPLDHFIYKNMMEKMK